MSTACFANAHTYGPVEISVTVIKALATVGSAVRLKFVNCSSCTNLALQLIVLAAGQHLGAITLMLSL